MDLSRHARTYVHWDAATTDKDGQPVDVSTVDVLLDGQWRPATVTPGDPGTVAVSLLVAGPAAEGNPDGTVVLPLGVHQPALRFADTPELVVAKGGVITVT